VALNVPEHEFLRLPGGRLTRSGRTASTSRVLALRNGWCRGQRPPWFTTRPRLSAYRRSMQDVVEIRNRKRRCNRAVLSGTSLMALALLVSWLNFLPPVATTAAAVTGFVLVLYGVHVGWLVFYDREPDGPAS
jgi:hypothetical protein